MPSCCGGLAKYFPPITLPEAFGGAAGTVGAYAAVLVVAVPLYVCATGSVPIAAALVAGGLPAGSALVFLMAGPATNVATIGAVYRALGGRTLAVYLGTIVAGSVGAGLLFEALPWLLEMDSSWQAPGHHGEDPAWWELGSAAILSAMMLWFALGDLRSLIARKTAAHRPESVELAVAGMTCNGCRSKLENALLVAVALQERPVLLLTKGALTEPCKAHTIYI